MRQQERSAMIMDELMRLLFPDAECGAVWFIAIILNC